MSEDTTYQGKYCNETDVLALFGDISDTPSSDLIKVAIDNTEAWIESNIKRHYVPIPTTIPQTLKTVAIYYAASDILMSLYHGEEYQSLMDYWFNKAQELLDAYIDDYLHNTDDAEELGRIVVVGHRNSRTYNERHRKWERYPIL